MLFSLVITPVHAVPIPTYSSDSGIMGIRIMTLVMKPITMIVATDSINSEFITLHTFFTALSMYVTTETLFFLREIFS